MIWLEIDEFTARAKVFGGWLVKVSNPVPLVMPNGEVTILWHQTESIAFVPDPTHEWQL